MSEPDVFLAFTAERGDGAMRVGLSAFGADGEVVAGLSGEIDFAAARAWLDHFERALGSGRARTFVAPAGDGRQVEAARPA